MPMSQTAASHEGASPLRALYYPFSRCVDACALKQLLLIFDSVTFLEPVDDIAWRAKLYRDLETQESATFKSFRALQAQLQVLEQEGAISMQRPDELDAFRRIETSAAALSDLADPVWCEIARRPGAFGLPYQARGPHGHPTWHIFPNKLPSALRQELSSPSMRQHLVRSAGEEEAWMLSYEAGSAATLNLHLAAAGDLGLAPVTDSAMHHRLLLRKLVRSSTPESQWTEPSPVVADAAAHSTAQRLVEGLLPREALEAVSFEKILVFREETRGDRAALVNELKASLAKVAASTSLPEISGRQNEINAAILKDVREYQASLAAARDKVWPGLVKATASGVVAGSAAALTFEYLVGGSLGLLAGSIAGASMTLLQSSLEFRAEERKVLRGARPSVAYLSKVARLA